MYPTLGKWQLYIRNLMTKLLRGELQYERFRVKTYLNHSTETEVNLKVNAI